MATINTNVSNNYFDSVSDFCTSKPNNNATINIMHINAQSCANIEKFDEIKYILDNSKHRIDVVIISETWFKPNQLCLYNITGYTPVHSCREQMRGGGLSIYIKEPCNIAKTEIKNDVWNLINVELRNFKGLNKLNICGVYRPPRRANLCNYLQELERLVAGISGDKVLIGDMNIDMSKPTDRDVKRYTDTMTSLGLTLCNDKITRESSTAILDHVYTNMESNRKIHTATVKCNFSDHNLLITSIESRVIAATGSTTTKKIDYDKLASFVEEKINDIALATDPNVHYDALCDLLQSALAQATTTKLKKEVKRKYCEWLQRSPNVIKLIKKKNNLYRKHKVTIKNRTCDPRILVRLRELQNQLTEVKRIAKNTYYDQLFTECRDTRSTWRAINNVISTAKTKSKSNDLIIKKNNIEIQSEYVAEEFVDHFATVASKIATKIGVQPDDSPNKLDTIKYSTSSIFLNPVTPDEIHNLIAAMKTKKAYGLDNISAKTIKCCAVSLIPHLVTILNNCFEQGIYPDSLKSARLVPIYKAGDKNDVANYRPISVLPVLNTIFERAILNRLLFFLESKKYFYNFQYGFRKKSSTKLALAEILDTIQRRVDAKQIVTGLFMDLSKAFDCVDHNILLYKLEMAGIRGCALQLFTSYLTNRKMIVNVNGKYSGERAITIGVPQGSVVGSILYLIYVNDMGHLKLSGKLCLFADDSSVFYANKTVQQNMERMKPDIEIINEYFRLNKLSLNANKTKFVHFAPAQKKFIAEENLNADGFVIEKVNSIKYLGVHIDSQLTWANHVDHVCGRVAAAAGILRKLSFLPRKILRQLYFSLAHSHLSYAAIVWASATDSILNKLQILQRRALKAYLKLNLQHPTLELFINEASHILPLKAIRVQQACELVFRSIHCLTPANLSFGYVEHRRSQRRQRMLYLPPLTTKTGRSSLSYFGPLCYNQLGPEITRITLEASFKRSLKMFLNDTENMRKYIR